MYIKCCDALQIIHIWDTTETFFYLDPPYVRSDRGYYEWVKSRKLWCASPTLKTLKGKFLLSSYHNEPDRIIKRNDWHT